jgi:hypothetical protein
VQKCVAENCKWFDKYGVCADVCRSKGFAKVVTNYDNVIQMSKDQLAMMMAEKILENDRTVKNKVQAVCLKMALYDKCYRWLDREVSNDRT